jgi:hypothetical protein
VGPVGDVGDLHDFVSPAADGQVLSARSGRRVFDRKRGLRDEGPMPCDPFRTFLPNPVHVYRQGA